jgi:hypothetical protein
MQVWTIAVLSVALTWQTQVAEACACCDAKYRRTPVGWTEAGGAILIDAFDTEGCEPRRRLEIWPVGAKEPSGCYDLYGDPEKKIDCAKVQPAYRPKDIAKPSTQSKLFPKPAVPLDLKKVRVTQTSVPDTLRDLQVTVEVDSRRVWTGVLQTVGAPESPKLSVTLWPNARGDRAVMLVSYIKSGTGNQAVDVHWVELRP